MDQAHDWDRVRIGDRAAQSRLVRELQQDQLPHSVAEDGTILAPRGGEFKVRLDDLLDSVFPKGWYRAQIDDPAVAIRYRRFTRRHGTIIVDETIDGRQWFVQALREKIYRYRGMPTHASFLILRDDLEPEQLTEQLGLEPSFACRRGEPLVRPTSPRKRSSAPILPSWTGAWELASIPAVESNELQQHLDWLLELLEPVEHHLRGFAVPGSAQHGRVFDLSLVGPEGDVQSTDFNARTLKWMAKLCDRMTLRVWPDDYL